MTDRINLPLAEADVEVHVVAGYRACAEHMEWYAQAFLAVWRKLPERDRNHIARHWAKKAYGNRPAIIVDDPWCGDLGVLATAEDSGLCLKFRSRFFAQVPDHVGEVLETLMAHELAHVLQWATGKTRPHLTVADLSGAIPHFPLPLTAEGLVELHADETILRWGFDPYEIDAWQFRYMMVDKKQDRLVPRKKPLTRGAYTKGRWQRLLHYYDLQHLRTSLTEQ